MITFYGFHFYRSLAFLFVSHSVYKKTDIPFSHSIV
jgi:hypothetical protein